ncbi:MAG: tetratricopeptide repeat protein, partial [Verrucomicrobiota bacterium]
MHTTRHPQSRPLVLATFAVLSTFVAPGCSKAARTTRILEQANVHLAAGELEKAEIEFKNALQTDGQNAEAISRLGLLYHEQGRDSRAAAFLLRARELQPENLAIRYRLGLAHLSAGGAKQAREEALFILERRPDDAEAPLLLVEASVTPSELEETRQRLLALKPTSAKSPAGLVALGNIALRQNRSKEAEESFQAAIAIDPKFAAAYGSLGLLHWSKKDAAAADAAFKQAFDLSPDRSPRRLHYAQFKLQSGDVAEARQILEAMGRKTPDYLPIWSTLAEIALNERKLDEAEGFVAKSLAHESQHAETLLVSARIRLAKGEAAKAVEELDRLATMFPRSPQVSYQLGLAYAANGDTNKALT